MFTGLVDGQGVVAGFKKVRGGARLELVVPASYYRVAVGSSVSVDGCCLTVVQKNGAKLIFDLVPETLKRTYFKKIMLKRRVNLERPLRWNGRMDGHLVQGHVDGTALLVHKTRAGRSAKFEFHTQPRLGRFVIEKGSVALNGVSLTVGKVRKPGHFWVHLVPHTLKKTNLSMLALGARVNLEADLWLKARGH